MDAVFKKYPVAYLVRHAHRPPIPKGSYGHEIGLTLEGEEEAHKLAQRLKPYLIETVSSPVPRCVHTAQYFQAHSKVACLTQHKSLGAPGVYVENEATAGQSFLERTPEEVAISLIKGQALPGFSRVLPASRSLLRTMMCSMDKGPGLYPFVSHDYIISIFLNSLLKREDCEAFWPAFLEGVFIWRDGATLNLSFRSQTYKIKDF